MDVMLDEPGPWRTPLGWIRAPAALATTHPLNMKMKTARKHKTLRTILIAATSLQRFGWYLNNSYVRGATCGAGREVLAIGTCGNEALHNELRGHLRQVYDVHLPTMVLKLRLFTLMKQLVHDSALRVPSLRKLNQGRFSPVYWGGTSSTMPPGGFSVDLV